jgi:hypothetical protein
MKTLLASAAVATLLVFAAVASAQFTSDTLPANHHIHDCTAVPCVYPHLAVGFFPRILTGGDIDAYLNDAAVCNDATDKTLLPPNEDSGTPQNNQPLRAGVCFTRAKVIHLRSIDVNDPAPDGWSGPIAPVTLRNRVTYVTYWLLTPR